MTLKQMPDTSINKVYSKFVGSVLATSILVLGSQTIPLNCNHDNSRQVIYCNNENTNIYKSFTDSYCIIFNVPGYSNNKSISSGAKKMTINEEKFENLKKIDAIALLEDNWNDNGAKAFCADLITKVKNIITFLDIQPEVFPTACNSLQLEYDKADGSHMEIELMEGKEAEVFRINENGCESIVNISADIESINKVVNDFYGQHI